MSDLALARSFCLLSVCSLLLPPRLLLLPLLPPPRAGPPVMAPTTAAASWLSSPQCPAGWEKMPKWPPATTLVSPIAGLLPSIGNRRDPSLPRPSPPSVRARSYPSPLRLRSPVPNRDLPAPSVVSARDYSHAPPRVGASSALRSSGMVVLGTLLLVWPARGCFLILQLP